MSHFNNLPPIYLKTVAGFVRQEGGGVGTITAPTILIVLSTQLNMTHRDRFIQQLHHLLMAGFSPQDLHHFCLVVMPAFQPLLPRFSVNPNQEEMVQTIIQYADQQELLKEVRDWAKEQNPRRYASHADVLEELPALRPHRLYTPSQPLSKEEQRHQRNRANLIANMSSQAEEYFAGSLREAVRLELGMEHYPDALARKHWQDGVQRDIASHTPISQLYHEAGEALLILGAPGAGKTFTLWELASI